MHAIQTLSFYKSLDDKYEFIHFMQNTLVRSSDAIFESSVQLQIWFATVLITVLTVPTSRPPRYVRVSCNTPLGFTCASQYFNFSDTEAETILGLKRTWFVVTLISAFLVMLVCIVVVFICICRKGLNANARSGNGNVPQPNAPYPREYLLQNT